MTSAAARRRCATGCGGGWGWGWPPGWVRGGRVAGGSGGAGGGGVGVEVAVEGGECGGGGGGAVGDGQLYVGGAVVDCPLQGGVEVADAVGGGGLEGDRAAAGVEHAVEPVVGGALVLGVADGVDFEHAAWAELGAAVVHHVLAEDGVVFDGGVGEDALVGVERQAGAGGGPELVGVDLVAVALLVEGGGEAGVEEVLDAFGGAALAQVRLGPDGGAAGDLGDEELGGGVVAGGEFALQLEVGLAEGGGPEAADGAGPAVVVQDVDGRRHGDAHLVIDHPHRVAAKPSFWLAEPPAGADVVAPPVHWAGEHRAIQMPVGQGSAAMQAGVVDREEPAGRIADSEPAAG